MIKAPEKSLTGQHATLAAPALVPALNDGEAQGLSFLDAPVMSPRTERAHAMKNCVSVIVAVARLVEGELSPRGRERMARLEAASSRLRELLVADLCEEPATNTPRSCAEARVVRVAELVEGVCARLSDCAEQSRVSLAFECSGGHLVGVEADLHEALFNVVANAIEATPAGGRVLVTTTVTHEEDHVWTVTDTGPGISSSRLAQLGRPFTTGRDGGSGIGLAFVRKVIAAHGGVVHLVSAVGAGTCLSLWLPREPGRQQVP